MKPLALILTGTGIAVLVAVSLVNGLAGEDAKAASQAAKYKLVAPVEVVMEVADDMFYKMPDKLDAGKYKVLKKDALFLAELANVLGYASYEETKTDAQKKDAKKLMDAVKDDLLKMAEASDKEASADIKKLHAKVEEACDSCHEKYRDV